METQIKSLEVAHKSALNRYMVAQQSCDLAYRIRSYQSYLIARNAHNEALNKLSYVAACRKFGIVPNPRHV